MRVSVLEQCQYDCAYCRPGSITRVTSKAMRLRADEYARLAPLLCELGVQKARLTGGEPLLRPDIVDVVRALSPIPEIALTTNGQHLGDRLEHLVEAGLQLATVHVDSLDPARYRALMGGGDLFAVLENVRRAQSRLRSVKLNVVVQRDRNDDELLEFLSWSRRTGVEVRFIEIMNTGSASDYAQRAFFSGAEVLERIGRKVTVSPAGRRNPTDPAALYRTGDGVVFGVIASDTQPFCGACNRLRLSPDGRLRGCLYQLAGAPLGAALREGASDAQLRSMLRLTLADKRSHHPRVGQAPPASFSMAQTGG